MENKTIQHLINGLKKIVNLKNVKEVKDPMSILAGDADDNGWITIHPRIKKGFEHASKMAQEILDTMPKKD
jgi:hypothetical protein